MQRGFKSKCENLALQLRDELGLNKTDPLLPEILAKHLGVYLFVPDDIDGLSKTALLQLKKDHKSWSAVTISLGGTDIVIYNPHHIEARQSSDIMHELAHIILGHKPVDMLLFSKDDVDIVLRDYDDNLEEEANWLALALLLPREALVSQKKRGISDSVICTTYGVSRAVLNFRINKTGVYRQIRASG